MLTEGYCADFHALVISRAYFVGLMEACLKVPREREAQVVRVEKMREALRSESNEGLMLASNPQDNSVCAIHVEAEANCLKLVWKSYATSNQMRFIHEFMLLRLQDEKLCAILGDDTHVPTVHADDRRWIVEDWMPRAHASGLRRIAATTSQQHFGRVAIDEVHVAAPSGIRIRKFDDLEEARRWLLPADEG